MSTETRPSQPRYWCHICNAEVNIYRAPDPTCQQCNEQFIEELQSDDDPREFLAGANTTEHTHTAGGIHLPEGGAAQIFSYSPSTGRINNLNGDNSGEMGDDIFQYFTPRTTANEEGRTSPNAEGGATAGSNNPSPLGNFVQNLLTNMLGQNIDLSGQTPTTEGGPNDSTRPMIFMSVDGHLQPMPGMPGGMPTSTDENNERGTNAEGAAGLGGGGGANGRNNIASILQFLTAMTGTTIDGGLVGNPNDYVFSQTALDNIITQLMEQTGGASAPPPAPEQVIESLKKRPLKDEEKITETDCAVCKDQFENHEIVIELPCEHIFHDECIKPWLKLNGTCPVCRHSVLPEQESNDQNNRGNNDNNTNTNNNNNTQNTQQTRGPTTTEGNNNNNTPNNSTGGTTATFSFVSGGNGGNNGSPMPASWPLNLSSAFPWNLAGGNNINRPNSSSTTSSNNNNNNNTASNTSNTSSSSNNANNNNHMDEDLDLD